MPHYEKDNGLLAARAKHLLDRWETHAPTLSAGVKIDFLFAFGDRDDEGEQTGDAIRSQGVRALGLCRIVNLKDRTKGLGDVEILIDRDWWDTQDEDAQNALLDHELHHIKVTDKTDDLGRPKIRLRKHDHQFGWFNVIAERHGSRSQEQVQAKSIMDNFGQYYWPGIAPTMTIETGGVTTGPIPVGRFAHVSAEMANPSRA